MWCCEPDRVVVDELEWDEPEQLDLPPTPWKMPGPSSETESRAQDSSSECSGMMPREMAELPTLGPPVVSRAGVECDSSWAISPHRSHSHCSQVFSVSSASFNA
uniref:(northern house mosquito) hypothetical protein n=1 Tax=Culex pipiens TaxID=7175 RepID=A0A8D8D131_CULPI